MIEVIGIISQLVIFLLVFSFPFQPKKLNHLLNLKKNTLNYIDAHALNIIFFIYLATIFSFANLDLKTLFKFHIIISFIFFIVNFREIKSCINKSETFIFFIFLLIVSSIFFYISQNLKLEWDGHHWIEKALVFFNGSNIEEISKVKIHPHYPHVGSYIWAYFWKNSLLELEYLGRFFQPYFYVVSIFLLLNLLKKQSDSLKILFLLFIVLITFEPYLFAGYQEYLIFSSLIIALRFINLINFNNHPNYKTIFFILLIFYTLCWFKDEGLIYYLIFSITLIFFLNCPTQNKILFVILLIFLWVVQYLLQKYLIGIYDFPQKISLSEIYNDITNIKIFITKIYKITLHILISFIKYPLWLLSIFSIIGLTFLKVKLDKTIQYYLSCLLLNMGFIVSIFFTFESLDFMLRVSLDRLLFQTSGFYLIFLILILNKMNKIK